MTRGLFILQKSNVDTLYVYRAYAYYHCPFCKKISNANVGGAPHNNDLAQQTFKVKERICNKCTRKTYVELLNINE